MRLWITTGFTEVNITTVADFDGTLIETLETNWDVAEKQSEVELWLWFVKFSIKQPLDNGREKNRGVYGSMRDAKHGRVFQERSNQSRTMMTPIVPCEDMYRHQGNKTDRGRGCDRCQLLEKVQTGS
eukprot:GILK01012164.1.p2 GENE.GILK01012164.1~~GILK01012164.1.p2  ORF type:complete len:127 (-),score=15.66 GILK01012164.1:219-599(-)